MPQFKDYPELTDVADDDALVILDVSDTTDSPAGSTKYVQASSIYTQAAIFSVVDGTLVWSNSTGWSGVNEGTGKLRVTFPSAATAEDSQALTGSINYSLTSGAAGLTRYLTFTEITTTSCLVEVFDSVDGNPKNATISIFRMVG